MCAGDLEDVRRRLERPVVARFDLARMVIDCTIRQPNPVAFALAMPVLYGHTEGRGPYCDVLRNVHLHRGVDLLDRLNRRIGEAPHDLYVAVDSEGTIYQYDYRRQLLAEPALLRFVLARGGSLGFAGGRQCLSWYAPGYEATDPSAAELPEKALLDSLSKEELTVLVKPFSPLCSAQPMTETTNFAPNGFGTYLCKRGVVPCPDSRNP